MKKIIFSFVITIFVFNISFAADDTDSIKVVNLEQINITSYKETNYRNAPVSNTLLNASKIDATQISSIKDLSGNVPNFFIPDYGSAMSNAAYIRGIGSRNSSQSMTLYLDNVPYLDKSAFDFEFLDVSQIEVLRGPQGTLYGRNALGGIVNIYTLSPLNYQGTKISLSGGNYGYINAKATHYAKLNNKLGVSVGAYYNHLNGFFTNTFTGKSADDENSAGGRLKLAWLIQPDLKLEYVANFDYIKQNAFPYGQYDSKTGTTADPNFDGLGNYTRKTLNNSLSLKFVNEEVALTANLSHQYFKDQMNMDQDFTPLSIFCLQQNQKMNMLNGELILKSNTSSDYQWTIGANVFIQGLDMYAPVSFKEDAISSMLQPIFTKMNMTITSPTLEIPGWYNTNTNGVALFHQSTFNNLLTKGLSLTLGLRLDAEEINLDYNTNTFMDINMKAGPKIIPIHMAAELNGNLSTGFIELLPKAALKYEWNKSNFVYAGVSRGYKTGGYNVQAMSDLIQQKLMTSGQPNATNPDVESAILYQPEYNWNYEIGIQNSFLDNRLKTEITTFYMDVTGLQLTEFVNSGAGRMLTNAGHVTSKGFELALQGDLGNGFSAGASYGYANATFKKYTNVVTVNGKSTEVDYAGKHVPYAPQHTVGANLNYNRNFENSVINQLYATVSYNGMGKIYWTEANDISQNYYQLVNAKAGVKKGIFGVELWGKNLLCTEYNAFYFKSFGNTFFQKGKSLQFGATIKAEF